MMRPLLSFQFPLNTNWVYTVNAAYAKWKNLPGVFNKKKKKKKERKKLSSSFIVMDQLFIYTAVLIHQFGSDSFRLKNIIENNLEVQIAGNEASVCLNKQ